MAFQFNVPPPNYPFPIFGSSGSRISDNIQKSITNMQLHPLHPSRREFVNVPGSLPLEQTMERYLIEKSLLIINDDGLRLSVYKEQAPKNISSAKNDLKDLYFEIESLKESEMRLRSLLVDCSKNDWQSEIISLTTHLSNVESKLKRCNSPLYLKKLASVVNTRTKKRKKISKQKQISEEYNNQILSRRKKIHIFIDQELSKLKKENQTRDEQQKKLKEKDKSVEYILKMQQKAEQQIEVLEKLKVYRRAKRIQLCRNQLGEKYFEEEIDKLKDEWACALSLYKELEQQLHNANIANTTSN